MVPTNPQPWNPAAQPLSLLPGIRALHLRPNFFSKEQEAPALGCPSPFSEAGAALQCLPSPHGGSQGLLWVFTRPDPLPCQPCTRGGGSNPTGTPLTGPGACGKGFRPLGTARSERPLHSDVPTLHQREPRVPSAQCFRGPAKSESLYFLVTD